MTSNAATENSPLIEDSDRSDSIDDIQESIMGAESAADEKKKGFEKKSGLKRFIPGYGTYRLVKKAPLYSLYVLGLLLITYLLNQLNRYTLPITTISVAQDLHYGDKACMLSSKNLSSCSLSDDVKDMLTDACSAKDVKSNETACYVFNEYFNEHIYTYTNSCSDNATVYPCYYDYDGSGLDYQILAGPVFNNVYPLAGLFLGPLADFVSRKILLAICLFFLSVFSGVTGFAQAYWHLVVFRMLVAIFAAGCTPYAASLIADYFDPELRGSALGIYNWGIYLGYSLAFALGNQISKALNWRWVFYICGMIGIVVSPFLVITIREHPKKKDFRPETSIVNEEKEAKSADIQNEKKKKEKKTCGCTLPTKDEVKLYLRLLFKTFFSFSMPILLIAGGVRNAGGYVWAYNTEIFFHNYRKFSRDDITYFMSWIPLVCGSIGAFVGGVVSDLVLKFSHKGPYVRIWVLFISQLAAAPFALAALWIPTYPWCFLMLIPSNIIGEMWIGVTLAIVVDIVPSKIKTAAVAIYLFVITVIGGNFNLIVDPITKSINSQYAVPIALTITFPGLYFISSFLFLATFFVVRYDIKRRAQLEQASNEMQLNGSSEP